jgi:serine/threonine protein kinase
MWAALRSAGPPQESYEDNNQLVMVLELLQGGELLEHLKSVKHYSEQKAAQLFRQIADAVYFMHEK